MKNRLWFFSNFLLLSTIWVWTMNSSLLLVSVNLFIKIIFNPYSFKFFLCYLLNSIYVSPIWSEVLKIRWEIGSLISTHVASKPFIVKMRFKPLDYRTDDIWAAQHDAVQRLHNTYPISLQFIPSNIRWGFLWLRAFRRIHIAHCEFYLGKCLSLVPHVHRTCNCYITSI